MCEIIFMGIRFEIILFPIFFTACNKNVYIKFIRVIFVFFPFRKDDLPVLGDMIQ